MPSFANPFGLLALLGIPAILAIHFLQRKSVELPVSTLFLLEHSRRDAESGRRLDRIISSLPLWMQLLAVLLIAWILSEPRFRQSGSVQRIAIVLDSSASMAPFKANAISRLITALPSLQGSASSLEIIAMESDTSRPRLFAGSSLDRLRESLDAWQPRDSAIEPAQAIRLARSLVSREGTVLYLTDTPVASLPFEAKTLAVGERIENAGFTGVTFTTEEGTLIWRAMIRNYTQNTLSRTWTLRTSTGSGSAHPITLPPGALVTVQAAFPQDADQIRVELSPDRFPLDDTLPLVAPVPKALSIHAATSPAFVSLAEKLLRTLDAAVPAAPPSSADLSIISYDPLDPTLPQGNSIVFVEDGTRAGAYRKGGIVAEAHPLVDGLNWQSLLVRETIDLERLPADTVLLWQDKRPLIFLRTSSTGTRQLCFNFDLRNSNASTQPAFIVLLHRFAESVRKGKIAPESLQLETHEPISLASAPGTPITWSAVDPAGNKLSLPDPPHTAPSSPAFLTARQAETTLLLAAVHFADTREADFSNCDRSEPDSFENRSSTDRNTRQDPLWRVWLLVLLAALMVSWRRTQHSPLPA